MPYLNEHAVRLRDPAEFERFRRENDKFGDGIDAIWGIRADGSVELQALRFRAPMWGIDQVKEWLEEHGVEPMRIEPAVNTENGDYAEIQRGWVERLARLFRIGRYKEKGMALDEHGLDRLIENTDLPVPVLVEHRPTLHLGFVSEIWRKGKELWGRLILKPEAHQLIQESDAKSLSVGLVREGDNFMLYEVSVVDNPYIPDALLVASAGGDEEPMLALQFSAPRLVDEQEEVHDNMESIKDKTLDTHNGEEKTVMEGAPVNEGGAGAQFSETNAPPANDNEAGLMQLVKEQERVIRSLQSELNRVKIRDRIAAYLSAGKLTPASAKYAGMLFTGIESLSAQHPEMAKVEFSEGGSTNTYTLTEILDAFVNSLPSYNLGGSLPKSTEQTTNLPVLEDLRRMGLRDDVIRTLVNHTQKGGKQR